jgi:hypothetical protein
MSVAEVKPGARLRSVVSATEVVVIRAPQTAVELCCGGQSMVPIEEAGEPTGAPSDDETTQLGKRYVDEETAMELLCTKGGAGGLTVDGRALTIKGAKPLPSSD